MSFTSDRKQKFIVYNADAFMFAGLQAFFEHRRLGMSDAAHNRFGFNVIRAVPEMTDLGDWHSNDIDFLMVDVVRGYAVFEYGSEGGHLLWKGSRELQLHGTRYRQLCHPYNLDLIKIVSPVGSAAKHEEMSELEFGARLA